MRAILSDLVDMIGGGTPSKSIEAYWGGDIPWASVKDFKSQELRETEDHITRLGLDNSSSNLIPAGNIIIPTRMALGKVAINLVDMAINQDLRAFVVKDKKVVDKRYLFRFIESQAKHLESEGKGATVKGITLDVLKNLEVPLPALPEQRRIAAILDQADALRAKRREALAELDKLAQSIFVEMFGDASSHDQKSLQELCELITDGTHQTPTYADEGVIFLSAKNVTSGEIDWERIKYIPQSLHVELHRRLAPRVGDILLAKNGTTGVAAVVDRDCIFDIYVSLALLRPRHDVLPTYLLAAINSPSCKKQFNDSLKGIGVPNLHLKEIRQAVVPAPSLDKQREFVKRIDALADLKRNNRNALVEADLLFASLQHRAFRGEL